MIPQIPVIYFPKDERGNYYASLDKATVTLNDMREKTISTQVAIYGGIRPDFSKDWEVEFLGEKYIMPLREPQGVKANDSLSSKIDLTFQHWAIYQLKRQYFFSLTSFESGVVVPDKYITPIGLNLGEFVTLFSKVLYRYYRDSITIDLNPNWDYAKEPAFININYSYIWDILIKFHELFAVRWEIVARKDNSHEHGAERYVIRVGYPTTELDHIFEYGYEGGLMKVERQVQDENIRNILMGRGGEKNLTFRYFKATDPNNPSFPADPDWVFELANVPFDKLRSAEFRSYVQGWKYAHRQDYLVYDEQTGGVVGVLDNSRFVNLEETKVMWAYEKGYNDSVFDPVEFVADKIVAGFEKQDGDYDVEILPSYMALIRKGSSIDKYGPLVGSIEDNEEIYPSIQGVEIEGLGRIDETVDIEQVTNDVPDIQSDLTSSTLVNEFVFEKTVGDKTYQFTPNEEIECSIDVGRFLVEAGQYAEIRSYTLDWSVLIDWGEGAGIDWSHMQPYVNEIDKSQAFAVDDDGNEHSAVNIPEGEYTLRIKTTLKNTHWESWIGARLICNGAKVEVFSRNYKDPQNSGQTFNIWIKNIWGTKPKQGEDPVTYAHRVWDDILGNHLGEDAAVCFSTGWLSTSEDYEFKIVSFPVYDTTHVLNKGGLETPYYSHWRLTLARSNADYDSLGIYVPSTQRQGVAGDKFYFIGINLTQSYVEWAEDRLYNYKLDQLDAKRDLKPSWVVSLDKVRIGRAQYDDARALIDQLKVGASVRLADKRFIETSDIPLYLQAITYKFNEKSNSPNIVPDVEVTLGTDYTTTANPVATLQGEVSVLSQHMGATSVSNIQQIVRMVGDRIYLRKDGITDRSLSPTYFAALIASLGFRQGMMGGQGWGLFQDENGKWVLETDRVNVRDEMQVNTLVINQTEGRGGQIVESAARMEITFVERTAKGWNCFFDTHGGSVANLFKVDDFAYCQIWRPDNSDLKYYRRTVISTGLDYIELSYDERDGSGEPAVGDVLVQYGNKTDKERQFVIIRDVIGGGYERMLAGLTQVNSKGDEYYFAGYQSSVGYRHFIGHKDPKDPQFLEFINGKLTLSGILSLTTQIGDTPISEYIKSFIPDLDLTDWEYLRTALKDGETMGIGGLILSNLIMLGTGKASEGNFVPYSGINGQPQLDAKGMGIAAWYGGSMIDHEATPNLANFAKSLLRFDGSGYFASGYISWTPEGSGHLANGNLRWLQDGTLILNSGITIEGAEGSGIQTLNSIVNLLNKLTANFKPIVLKGNTPTEVNWSEVQPTTPLYAIKSLVGFYSDDFVSAMGLNADTGSGGGGGGGAEYLADLQDVSLANPEQGQRLVFNGSKWVNATNREDLISLGSLEDFLAENGSKLARTQVPHVYQVYYGAMNAGMLIINGSGVESNTIGLTFITMFELNEDTNTFTTPGTFNKTHVYTGYYVYTRQFLGAWRELGEGSSGGGSGTQAPYYEQLNEWVGYGFGCSYGSDPYDWNNGSFWEQAQRIIIPVNVVVYSNITSRGTTSNFSWDNDRFRVILNMSDNKIYLHDQGTGFYYSRWVGDERWKPSKYGSTDEFYKEGHIYVSIDGCQIVVFDSYYGGLRIIAGSMFMKSFEHELPSNTNLSQISIPYIDEGSQSAETKAMSLKEINSLLNTNSNVAYITRPSDLLTQTPMEFSGKNIYDSQMNKYVGFVKVFEMSGFILMLETPNIISGDSFINADNVTLRTYGCRLNTDKIWSSWTLIKEEKLPPMTT